MYTAQHEIFMGTFFCGFKLSGYFEGENIWVVFWKQCCNKQFLLFLHSYFHNNHKNNNNLYTKISCYTVTVTCACHILLLLLVKSFIAWVVSNICCSFMSPGHCLVVFIYYWFDVEEAICELIVIRKCYTQCYCETYL